MRPGPAVPETPPAPLTRARADIVPLTSVLWRVHRTRGEQVRAWNELREYGPLPSMRYDPQPEPPSEHPGAGVSYAAGDLATALAAVFQATRLIDTAAGAPHATAWQPSRPLALLDLTDTWPVRNGAAAALTSGDRSVCRTWARAICQTWPDLDGLLAPSTWTGRGSVVLWSPARVAFPRRPAFSRPLAHPLVWSLVRACAVEIGFALA